MAVWRHRDERADCDSVAIGVASNDAPARSRLKDRAADSRWALERQAAEPDGRFGSRPRPDWAVGASHRQLVGGGAFDRLPFELRRSSGIGGRWADEAELGESFKEGSASQRIAGRFGWRESSF